MAKFNLTLIRKRARPDMEWLLYEFDRTLTDSLNLSFFPVKKNPLLYESMGRIIIPFSRKTEKHYQQVSVRANPLVRIILSLTKEAITQEQLLQHILTKVPTLNHEKVIQVIHCLIQQEILYPTLMPTLLTKSNFLDSIDYRKENCPSSPLLAKFQKISIFFKTIKRLRLEKEKTL